MSKCNYVWCTSLLLRRSTARFDHFLHISQCLDSVMYKQDVIKRDRQDDNTAYRAFCSSNLKTVYLQHLENSDEEMCEFFVLLFIFGKFYEITAINKINYLIRIFIY